MTASIVAHLANSIDDNLSQTELAWAAGFFDGEGSTWATQSLHVDIPQAIQGDESEPFVLRRFVVAVGVPTEIHPMRRTGGKPIFKVRYSGMKAATVLQRLWPHLSKVKRLQAREAIESLPLKSLSPGRRFALGVHCRRGHTDGEWLGVFKKGRLVGRSYRVCKTCDRLRQEARRKGLKDDALLPDPITITADQLFPWAYESM